MKSDNYNESIFKPLRKTKSFDLVFVVVSIEFKFKIQAFYRKNIAANMDEVAGATLGFDSHRFRISQA